MSAMDFVSDNVGAMVLEDRETGIHAGSREIECVEKCLDMRIHDANHDGLYET